jgi:hypothetical protein
MEKSTENLLIRGIKMSGIPALDELDNVTLHNPQILIYTVTLVILTDAAEIMPGSIEASRENVLTFNW